MVAVTPVPESPIWVAGVINLHGKVIPVLNLRQRLGLSARQSVVDDHMLIVEALGQTIGIMVDQVTEILEVPQHQMETAPASLSRTLPTEAVIRRDGVLILALDVTWLLQIDGEIETIENLSEILAAEDQTIQDASQTERPDEDDLTQIKGIGEIYARRLKEGGVHSFAELAKSDPSSIADLLYMSGKRKFQVQKWIKQAAARLVKNTSLASI
jgi:purine-binding chemotaxis protein CheW